MTERLCLRPNLDWTQQVAGTCIYCGTVDGLHDYGYRVETDAGAYVCLDCAYRFDPAAAAMSRISLMIRFKTHSIADPLSDEALGPLAFIAVLAHRVDGYRETVIKEHADKVRANYWRPYRGLPSVYLESLPTELHEGAPE